MLAVRLMGGLGNQMFQYAFGRQLSLDLGVPLTLDLRWYEEILHGGGTVRKYELGKYPILATIADNSRLPGSPDSGRITRWSRKLLKLLGGSMSTYTSPVPGYDPGTPKSGNCLYIGYWQSEHYFRKIASELRAEFTPLEPPAGTNIEYTRQIEGCDMSVSLHVRRGDYANDPTTTKHHGLTPLEYYRKAVAMMKDRVGKPAFFVFSDEIEWCQANLDLGDDAVFVTGNAGEKAYEDLRLMSRCRHHIIANSSFSWWGAWLNPKSDKTVIAPHAWFHDPNAKDDGIVPESWIRI